MLLISGSLSAMSACSHRTAATSSGRPTAVQVRCLTAILLGPAVSIMRSVALQHGRMELCCRAWNRRDTLQLHAQQTKWRWVSVPPCRPVVPDRQRGVRRGGAEGPAVPHAARQVWRGAHLLQQPGGTFKTGQEGSTYGVRPMSAPLIVVLGLTLRGPGRSRFACRMSMCPGQPPFNTTCLPGRPLGSSCFMGGECQAGAYCDNHDLTCR